MKEIKFEFEIGEEYYFPYTDDIGAGCWEWSGNAIDFQRLNTVGIFRTEKGAIEESKKLSLLSNK